MLHTPSHAPPDLLQGQGTMKQFKNFGENNVFFPPIAVKAGFSRSGKMLILTFDLCIPSARVVSHSTAHSLSPSLSHAIVNDTFIFTRLYGFQKDKSSVIRYVYNVYKRN